MALTIRYERRPRFGDYKAWIDGETDHWGVGRGLDEAIGELVRTFPERFGVEAIDESPRAAGKAG